MLSYLRRSSSHSSRNVRMTLYSYAQRKRSNWSGWIFTEFERNKHHITFNPSNKSAECVIYHFVVTDVRNASKHDVDIDQSGAIWE